jgi:hypothetical protein
MELYCEDCGAEFRNQCHCSPQEPVSEEQETWRGMDGHLYIGDPTRASIASHADNCGCPGSVNFDPESWY